MKDYIFEDNAEKTLDEIFGSKMLGKEVKFTIVSNDGEDDPSGSALEREYKVSRLALTAA